MHHQMDHICPSPMVGNLAPLKAENDRLRIANANKHGHTQSVKLYATSATISVTKFWPETHIALPMNVATQLFHYLSK